LVGVKNTTAEVANQDRVVEVVKNGAVAHIRTLIPQTRSQTL
jgi:hypothetical protein